MTDERLLPVHYRLIGDEVLRVVGADGRKMLLPVSVLLDAVRTVEAPDADLLQAVDKMVTRIGEFFSVLESLTVRVAAVEKAQPIEDAAIGTLRTDLAKLVDRVVKLEAEIKLKKDK